MRPRFVHWERVTVTEYEKASLLMQAAMLDYLHVIAWAHRNGSTNGKRIEDNAKRLAERMQADCPSAVGLLAGSRLPTRDEP